MDLGDRANVDQAAEFPDASFGGFGDRVRASVPGRAAAEPPVPPRESKIDQLERITALKEKGALSEEQYEAAKAWDAAILEAARSLGCDTVLSEDLSDGQDYAGVRVENPFR